MMASWMFDSLNFRCLSQTTEPLNHIASAGWHSIIFLSCGGISPPFGRVVEAPDNMIAKPRLRKAGGLSPAGGLLPAGRAVSNQHSAVERNRMDTHLKAATLVRLMGVRGYTKCFSGSDLEQELASTSYLSRPVPMKSVSN